LNVVAHALDVGTGLEANEKMARLVWMQPDLGAGVLEIGEDVRRRR